MIVIGIDPHKRSHTATAVDPGTNQDLGSLRIPSSAGGYAQLTEWAEQWPDRLWAIENAKGLGRHLAQWLIRVDDAHVVDVPPTATARVRQLSRGGQRKNDRIDAAAAACVAFTQGDYRRVAVEDITDELRVIAERRTDVMVQYRRLINQLHALAREMIAGGVPTTRAVERIVVQIRAHRPISPTDQARHDVAMEIIGDLRRARFQIDHLTERLAAIVESSQTRLPETRGFGPVTTAIVLARVGDPSRFRSEAAFAAFTGTAPIEVASGDHSRHRLSRAGDRQLNSVLHFAALSQRRKQGCDGQIYYQRKIEEGKTPREAMRCLKRQISKQVWRTISTDHRPPPGDLSAAA